MATIDPTLLTRSIERAQVRPQIHTAAGERNLGTTAEVRSLLQNNAKRKFSLRDVRSNIGADADANEINSVLSKLVKAKLVKCTDGHNGVRSVNMYQWSSDAKSQA